MGALFDHDPTGVRPSWYARNIMLIVSILFLGNILIISLLGMEFVARGTIGYIAIELLGITTCIIGTLFCMLQHARMGETTKVLMPALFVTEILLYIILYAYQTSGI